MKIRTHIENEFITRDVKLFIIGEGPNGAEAIATAISFYKLDPGLAPPLDAGRILDRSFGRQEDFIQSVLDAAWEHGMRPTGYSNVAETMRAGDKHLQDMRAIAFHKLGVPKP